MSSCFFDALVRRLGGWGEGAVIPGALTLCEGRVGWTAGEHLVEVCYFCNIPVVDCGCISEVYAPGEHPPHIRDSPGISI